MKDSSPLVIQQAESPPYNYTKSEMDFVVGFSYNKYHYISDSVCLPRVYVQEMSYFRHLVCHMTFQ